MGELPALFYSNTVKYLSSKMGRSPYFEYYAYTLCKLT